MWLGRCWCGRSGSGMNCHDLLLLCGLLILFPLPLVSKISLVIIPLLLVNVGSHGALFHPMVNKLLGKTLGTVERCWVCCNHIPLNQGR